MEGKNSFFLSFLLLSLEGLIISFLFLYSTFGGFGLKILPFIFIIILLVSLISIVTDAFKHKKIMNNINFNKLKKIIIIDNIFYKRVKIQEVTGKKYVLGNYLSTTFVKGISEEVEERVIVEKKNYFKFLSLTLLFGSLIYLSYYLDKSYGKFESVEVIYQKNNGQIVETNKLSFVVPQNKTFVYIENNSASEIADEDLDVIIESHLFDDFFTNILKGKGNIRDLHFLELIYDNNFGLISKLLRNFFKDENEGYFFYGEDFYAYLFIIETKTILLFSDKNFKEEIYITTDKSKVDEKLMRDLIGTIKKR